MSDPNEMVPFQANALITVPDLDTFALVADVQYHEPYVSGSLNRKFRGIVSPGIYNGYLPAPGEGLQLLIGMAEDGFSTASVNFGEYQITVQQRKPVALDLMPGLTHFIVLQVSYALGQETNQVNTKSTIAAAEIKAVASVGQNQIDLATVTIPAGATQITEDMIDWSRRKVVRLGIEISSAIDSTREDVAASSLAIKLVMDQLVIAEEGSYPIGSPIPWPLDVAPTGYAIMAGQSFNVVKYTKLAMVYVHGVLPDMREKTIKGASASRLPLTNEMPGIGKHTHSGAIAQTDLGTKITEIYNYGTITSERTDPGSGMTTSFDYGTKTTSTTGEHAHMVPIARGGDGGDGKDGSTPYTTIGQGDTVTTTSGAHSHAVGIGSHAHTMPFPVHSHAINLPSHSHSLALGSHSHAISISSTGNPTTTVLNTAFHWIVRLV